MFSQAPARGPRDPPRVGVGTWIRGFQGCTCPGDDVMGWVSGENIVCMDKVGGVQGSHTGFVCEKYRPPTDLIFRLDYLIYRLTARHIY